MKSMPWTRYKNVLWIPCKSVTRHFASGRSDRILPVCEQAIIRTMRLFWLRMEIGCRTEQRRWDRGVQQSIDFGKMRIGVNSFPASMRQG